MAFEIASKPAKRTVIRSARFTPDEWAEVSRRASEVKLTSSRFLRHAALGARFGGRINAAALRELSAVGNNLNQLARTANRREEEAAMRDLAKTLAAVRGAIAELLRR